MEQAIQLDNEAIAQNNTAYWENLTDQVKLRDGFIRDQEYLMAYALYQFNYRETPIYATGQALIQQEITEEQLYSQLNAWTLADQLVYPAIDFVGLIPGVDIGADLVGFFYAQLRGDMQQIPLYAMALMIPPGFDNIAHYGGRGASRMVAVYTENGITYVPKLADEPIDEAVEAVRASVLTHDPIIAQAIIDADAPYVFHEADELYKKRYSAIYPGTGNDLAKAKLITGEIADHFPLLLANPQLVTRELSEVLAGMPDATKRKAFLEALDGFGDIGKLTTFVEDLVNAPELVVALKGKWELVRAWEALFEVPQGLRNNIENLRAIDAFETANPSSLARIREILSNTHADKIKASRRQAFINGLGNVADNNGLELTNKRLASVDEVKDAVNNLREYRSAHQQIPQNSNLGKLSGIINGQPIYPSFNSHETWIGGEHYLLTPRPETQAPIWPAIEVPSNNGGSAYLRNIDSEYNMLTDLARKLQPNAVMGQEYANHTGDVRIISEIAYCESCQGIIQEFNTMFPNIKIILIDGIK